MEVFEGVKHFNEQKIKRRGTFLKSGRLPSGRAIFLVGSTAGGRTPGYSKTGGLD